MGLVVSIIIGVVALTAILGFMLNTDPISDEFSITYQPFVIGLDSHMNHTNITVRVTNENQHPVHEAVVIVRGYQVINATSTDTNGVAVLPVSPCLPSGISEAYLDIIVKKSGYRTTTQSNCIKVISIP